MVYIYLVVVEYDINLLLFVDNNNDNNIYYK